MGRYGKGAEDSRFYPLYIAYWDLVRGYESFSNEELTHYEPESRRRTFDYSRLYGSKMLMGNVELRFPLLGIFGIGKGYFGAWPLEFYAFYDWGIAYAQGPSFWWGATFLIRMQGTPCTMTTAIWSRTPRPGSVKPWFVSDGSASPSRATASACGRTSSATSSSGSTTSIRWTGRSAAGTSR